MRLTRKRPGRPRERREKGSLRRHEAGAAGAVLLLHPGRGCVCQVRESGALYRCAWRRLLIVPTLVSDTARRRSCAPTACWRCSSTRTRTRLRRRSTSTTSHKVRRPCCWRPLIHRVVVTRPSSCVASVSWAHRMATYLTAYEVLSDPETRRLYDHYGAALKVQRSCWLLPIASSTAADLLLSLSLPARSERILCQAGAAFDLVSHELRGLERSRVRMGCLSASHARRRGRDRRPRGALLLLAAFSDQHVQLPGPAAKAAAQPRGRLGLGLRHSLVHGPAAGQCLRLDHHIDHHVRPMAALRQSKLSQPQRLMQQPRMVLKQFKSEAPVAGCRPMDVRPVVLMV